MGANRKIKMLEDDLYKAETSSEAFESKVKELEIEVTSINNVLKKMEAAEGLQSEREEKLEENIRDLEQAKSDLSIRAENAERQIQVLEENILKLESDLEKEQEEHNTTKEELAAVNAEIDDI